MVRKGQIASIETMLIVGLVLVTTIPLGAWTISGLNQKWSESTKLQEATLLRDAIETVSQLGPGNSISIPSVTGYSVVNNHIVYGDLVDIPVLSVMDNYDAGGGVIEVINTVDGVFVGNAPKIDDIDASDRSKIKIFGKHFSEDTKVLVDLVKVESTFISETEINLGLSKPGKYGVHLVRTVGDKDLSSNIFDIWIKGGGPVQKPKKSK